MAITVRFSLQDPVCIDILLLMYFENIFEIASPFVYPRRPYKITNDTYVCQGPFSQMPRKHTTKGTAKVSINVSIDFQQ